MAWPSGFSGYDEGFGSIRVSLSDDYRGTGRKIQVV